MLKLFDFYADWCGPCQVMKPVFAQVEKEMAGKVEFVKVNVDQDQRLAQEKGVLSIPTYILEKDSNEIGRKTGAMSKETLVDWIEESLG